MSAYESDYRSAAGAAGMEWWWLCAIARVETGENQAAYRCGHGERRYWGKRMANRAPWTRSPWYSDPDRLAARYGLMALPYHGAIEVGWDLARDPLDLLDPAVNILWAARYLAGRMARYCGHISPAISAYGSAWGVSTYADGQFSNQRYVDRVSAVAEQIRRAQMPQDGRSARREGQLSGAC
jgi:soluble lytic murein transglycosylase-like protein